MSDSINPRSPCIVGTARHTWNDEHATPEPLEMWHEVSRAAAVDAVVGSTASSRDVLNAVDDIGLVHCQSWYYDDPPLRLAQRLDTLTARREESILAGTSPQRLCDAAAARMLAGETSVALVVGGEALGARRVFDRGGIAPGWSYPHPHPPMFPVDLHEWYLPTEIAHGVLPAWLTFALLEQARWAERGATAIDRDRMGAVMDRLNAVASENPDAWFPQRHEAGVIATPTRANRMVATPYTKLMTAFLDVDMAAANLMVTHEVADQWGVPPERRVYLRGWGFARDEVHIAARNELGSSPAMRSATTEAFGRAGLSIDDVDVFDLYSCFPSAVQFATDALGIDEHDPRALSVTGGLPYHGGPGSNYMGHSISHMVDRLRLGDACTGMVTGVGMHMTKHVAGIWSTTPGPIAVGTDHGPQRWGQPDGRAGLAEEPPARAIAERADGPATLAAATVVRNTASSEPYVAAICDLSDDVRCYARSDRADLIEAVVSDRWAQAPVHVKFNGTTNELIL